MSDTTDRLREVAGQATPGPWRQDDGDSRSRFVWAETSDWVVDVAECLWADEDAAHISTFDPVLVGAMLDVIDAAERVKDYVVTVEKQVGLSREQQLWATLARFHEVAG